MAEKSVNNLLEGIEKSKEKPFSKVLFGLGIRYVGETVAKRLAKAFGSLDALQSASVETLTAPEEIGERIAQSLVDYFAEPSNQRLLEALHAFGLQMEEVQTAGQSHPAFKGKRFVVSGVFERYSREGIKNEIEQLGGIIVSSVSSKTDYLVAGEGMGPAKKTKAETLNVSILSEPDFIAFKENRE
jgi:DNA ligase (NAD+)